MASANTSPKRRNECIAQKHVDYVDEAKTHWLNTNFDGNARLNKLKMRHNYKRAMSA